MREALAQSRSKLYSGSRPRVTALASHWTHPVIHLKSHAQYAMTLRSPALQPCQLWQPWFHT